MTKTMYDYLIDSFKDKHFQLHPDSFDVIELQEISLNEKGIATLIVLNTLEKKRFGIPLKYLKKYTIITEEEFAEIKNKYDFGSVSLLKVPCTDRTCGFGYRIRN